MPFSLTTFNLTTAVVIVGTLSLIYLRYKTAVDSNVPLIYWAIMLLYANTMGSTLSPTFIYVGILLALILRFEFINDKLVRMAILTENLVLAVIAYESTAILMQWD